MNLSKVRQQIVLKTVGRIEDKPVDIDKGLRSEVHIRLKKAFY